MVFKPRNIESRQDWRDEDNIKLYTITALDAPVDQGPYLARLAEVKRQKAVNWPNTPAFVIFHEGATYRYLVLAWWGNDNELFTSVSVHEGDGWVEDPAKYSFCLWDLEVFWFERNAYVDLVYCDAPDLDAYRDCRLAPAV